MAEFEIIDEAFTISDIPERTAPPSPARGSTMSIKVNPLTIDSRWKKDALCRKLTNPKIMHPGPGNAKGVEVARGVCASCTVKLSCYIDLVTDPPPIQGLTGITAGLSTRQQKAAIKAHRQLAEFGELHDFIASSQFAADVAINSTFDEDDINCIF